MSFPRYPKYKPIGVEWLGDVPEGWTVVALAYRYEVALGKMLDAKQITGEHLAPYLRNADVQWGRINTTDLNEMDFDAEDRIRYSLRRCDLLVCEGGEVGRSAVWAGQVPECYYQKALHRLRPHDPARDSPSFLQWVLYSAVHGGCFAADESKATIAHLPAEALRRHRFALPSHAEQSHIAAFLDRETAKIDGLVGEQQRLIELLKEKRQAVISHAVTKGPNPNAPMKPSGIEWLGDVPEHWAVSPLKYVVRLRSGGTPSKARLDYWEGDVPWASSKDLKSDSLFDTADHITRRALAESAAELVPSGSLLVVVRGMILAHTFPVSRAAVPMAINQDLKALLPLVALESRFLEWTLRGSQSESLRLTDEAGHGTKVLRMDTWTAMSLPIPPLYEQLAIVASVDTETTRLDALTAEAQRAIALLQERRTALISAAVTGQIDVRSSVEQATA